MKENNNQKKKYNPNGSGGMLTTPYFKDQRISFFFFKFKNFEKCEF